MRQVGRDAGKQSRQIKVFLRNPYKASKSVLDPKCEIHLKCEKKPFSDSFYDDLLPHLSDLPSAPSISKDFSGSTFKEDLSKNERFLTRCQYMIPYKVYKNFFKLPIFEFKSLIQF